MKRDCELVLFLRHFNKGSEKLLLKIPLGALSHSKILLNIQLFLNRYSDKRQPLSDEGKINAKLFQHRLIRFVRRNRINVEKILTSPFVRTLQTAEYVSTIFPKVPIEIDGRIRDMDQGVRYGRRFEDICRFFPSYVEDIESKGYLFSAPPGADTHVARRDDDVRSFLGSLSQISGSIMVVTHAGIIECIHNLVYQTSDKDVVKKFAENRSAREGSLLVCRRGENRILVPWLENHLL